MGKNKSDSKKSAEHSDTKVFYTFFAHRDNSALRQGKGGLKPATAINVRHILCERHSKALEALEKIQV